MISDEDLLDFDTARLAGMTTGRTPRKLLYLHGDLYRHQLVMARHLELWARRQSEVRLTEFQDGFMDALTDIAAHLRQGDYLPDGKLYREGTRQ